MIRVACIGTGGISATHLRYLASRADVTIAALCDIDEENLAGRCKEFGGQPFSDFRVMLDKVPLDAVWVCTPQQVRREPLLACAQHRLPVFCE
jgi:predicted dehydrogenase